MDKKKVIYENLLRFGGEIGAIDIAIESLQNMRKSLLREDNPNNSYQLVSFEFTKVIASIEQLGYMLFPNRLENTTKNVEKIIVS